MITDNGYFVPLIKRESLRIFQVAVRSSRSCGRLPMKGAEQVQELPVAQACVREQEAAGVQSRRRRGPASPGKPAESRPSRGAESAAAEAALSSR